MFGMNFALSLSACHQVGSSECSSGSDKAKPMARASAQGNHQSLNLRVPLVFLQLSHEGHRALLVRLEAVLLDDGAHELCGEGNHHHEELAQIADALLLHCRDARSILGRLKNVARLLCSRCSHAMGG